MSPHPALPGTVARESKSEQVCALSGSQPSEDWVHRVDLTLVGYDPRDEHCVLNLGQRWAVGLSSVYPAGTD